ncbi:hypothetical protein [Leptospira stimsonii]|uniref:Uncharacterized protein n=1 Tax=Leptospira stimsonii TaxID=2202203 RepID=A0ABY2NBC1_9LEPT|nr:hypothetical protein [Leptospira stimsonii]TGK10367.1 hypothetical protein EHO98_22915 [Leptospira stimsonii]TGM20453.1 hypothetical protein EHQ90_02590 [Leptospira stimsonii]
MNNDVPKRREYISEKILNGERIYFNGDKLLGWFIPSLHRFFPADTDFEFLPEWTGPICEVVLPILAERECWIIFKPTSFWINNLSPEEYLLKDFTTALVDAYIKITKENAHNVC